MKTLVLLFCIGITLMLVSCSNESPTEVVNQNNLVVEAFIYSGEPVSDIRLTITMGLNSSDTTAPPVNGAGLKDLVLFILKLS